MSETAIKRLGLALLLALALWGLLALISRAREDRVSRIHLARVDTAAVDTVTLGRKADSLVLARGAAGAWSVNGHAADTARVHEFLRALDDSAVWGEVAAESRASHGRLGVDADSGRQVRVRGHGRALLDLTVGKRTSDWAGVYMRRGAEDAVYALHSAALADAFTRGIDDWRDKRITHVVADSVAVAEVHRGGAAITLKRDGAKWSLGSGAAADSGAVARLLDAYTDLNASGFATTAQLDSAHFSSPRGRVKFLSKTGAVLAALAFDSTANGIWVRADTGGTVFRVDPWQLGRLAPPESTFKAKKK